MFRSVLVMTITWMLNRNFKKCEFLAQPRVPAGMLKNLESHDRSSRQSVIVPSPIISMDIGAELFQAKH
ncbi:hypothetical protein KIN20_023571 [Parelaphostrongylus tenuis]|uniref:Uncharacterized protein n=1 Tax=Parelaphostrongylus tenuis TaxID=148309 RepID=A0AAD5QXF0_PARTN|nr:hypothetical protein KIN20_023571 [Parelaphostrongylus tenuis]